MSIAVELPELGESVIEGTVARWLVQVGDRVERDQPLVEVTTDKVDAEIPAPVDGVVEKILVMEGETVEVGTQLVLLDDSPAAVAAASPASAPAEPAAPAAAPAVPETGAAAELRATPVARRMAEEARLDLQGVEGTGSAGRITKSDVERHAASASAPGAGAAEPAPPPPRARPAAPAAPSRERPAYAQVALEEGDRVIPMSPLRKLVAEHMVYSKRTSPHVGTVAEVDMGGVVALRDRHKRDFREVQGFSLTFLPFIVAATVRALREFPSLNASVVDDAIVERAGVHIGIAVETEKGLVVPVLRSAERLSLTGMAAAIEDLSNRARSKRLSLDDLRGGTFTLSNPGRQGNLYGFAIINQPQVGILRMGEIVKRPVVVDAAGQDAIAIRPMMHLALSYDHRAVDGAPANGFLYRVRELLEAADFEL
ncbi:MAG: dihydrolipoamide acetyltransferase family protein [Proteobacteria bacterium]|nr:dihydrolipoamide acetyltransferase family protein [Pseudomonadota bacterium]